MSQFLDSLCITELDDVFFQIIDHPFRYQSDIAGAIEVPIGFKTDFASIPIVFLALLGDCAHEAAVIHDWLYYSSLVKRSVADQVLREAMRITRDLPRWKIPMIYFGVRVGGWKAWNNHRKAGHSATDFTQRPAA